MIYDPNKILIHPRSFKDNDALVFSLNSIYYRCIKKKYANEYKHLIDTGLYEKLTNRQLLIKHEECIFENDLYIENAHIFCKPEQLDMISFPNEWCFSQFKDSAIATLDILKIAIDNGMILKDANSINIQLHRGKAILIDTSSFCKYCEGDYWKGYKQFLEHFFIPLKLANTTSVEIFKLLLYFKEGIPISKSIFFFKAFDFFNFSAFIHIFLFSKYTGNNIINNTVKKKLSKLALLGILNSLYSGIAKLKKGRNESEWIDYYSNTNNYENSSFDYKAKFILEIIENQTFSKVLDFGSNTGYFSRLIHKHVDYIISVDNDSEVVDLNYRINKKLEIKNIYPLVIDFLNPTPSFGFSGKEYESFQERAKSDLVLALALIHHLYFKHYISFSKMADLFFSLGKNIIVEFVEQNDSQILLFEELFEGQLQSYNSEAFENAFLEKFTILRKDRIIESHRLLYHFKRIN
jgi:SAM-dependent methyltransferase